MKNRSKIISSILFWVLVLLVSIYLLSAFSKSSFDWTFSFNNNDDRILIQQQTITEPIESLAIDWTAGSITVEGTNQSTIEIKEYANKNLSEKEKASIDVDKTALAIESNIHSTFTFVFWQSPKSHLHVLVPYDMLNKLEIRHTSGTLLIQDIEANSIFIKFTSGIANFKKLQSESMSIDMTSGSMNFDQIVIDKLDIDLTSGSVNANKMTVDAMNASMTSGLLNIEFVNTPPSMIDWKINAGNATIDLPENADFSLDTTITSGSLNANFPHTTNNNVKTYKNGRDSYTLKITSGSVTVNIP